MERVSFTQRQQKVSISAETEYAYQFDEKIKMRFQERNPL